MNEEIKQILKRQILKSKISKNLIKVIIAIIGVYSVLLLLIENKIKKSIKEIITKSKIS